MEQFIRSKMLYGKDYIDILKNKKVAIFGIGGVGGYVAEALARIGVGSLSLFDHDEVSISNLNRQIVALHSTIGKYKVDVMKSRIKDINPNCNVQTHKVFYNAETAEDYNFSEYDFIVDAIDTVSAKLILIQKAKEKNVNIISSMGTGNKLDPTKLKITKLEKTEACPLARVMRYECKKRNIKDVTVLYSEELAVKPFDLQANMGGKKSVPGSNPFVPSSAGLIIASYVVGKMLE